MSEEAKGAARGTVLVVDNNNDLRIVVTAWSERSREGAVTMKRIALCALLLALCCPAAMPKGGRPVGRQRPEWQFSEAPSVTLGVRDKYAQLKSYSATFVVTTPAGRKFYKTIKIGGDDFGEVKYPDDFLPRVARGAANVTGAFSWECVVNGETAARGRFVLENSSSLEMKRPGRGARR